jgi:putative ABC transport system ATP-binding protein
VTGLRIRDLTIEYVLSGYAVRPIDQLNATAEDGQLAILLGPSGSGKTTLLSCIAGLLTPATGSIRVADVEVTSLEGAALSEYRRRRVGIIFQAFNLIASLTAQENVAMPLQLAGIKRRTALGRAAELLERVGLKDRMSHRPTRLSGGQQQRVAIARALVHDPPLIVADEPTAHLDYVQVEGVLQLIRDLAAPGRLVVVSTHDARFSPLADRVIDLAPVESVASGTRRVTVRQGEVLFEQGDLSDLVYFVEEGAVELFRRRVDGTDEVFSVVSPGHYFGEVGPLLGLRRSAAARAVEDTVLLGYGARDFSQWMVSERRKAAVTQPES